MTKSASDTHFIPVNEPLLDGNEAAYLQQCIDTGWISSEGPFVERFEREMAGYTGRSHAVAVSSGSAALELAVEALGLQAGDEVIIPTLTIISCAAPLARRGIIPVCVDCDERSFTMDIEQVATAVTPKTRAIMAVHIYGLPADMDALLHIAQKHDLLLIEDAAEAHGLYYKDRPCGSFGDVSIFSFYPNKLVTTGEGGMLLTDNSELAQQLRDLRNLCFQPGKRFVHEELGYNYRMSNVQAALGCAQLERLDEFAVRKQVMGRCYTRAFGPYQEQLQLPLDRLPYADNGYWVYPLVLRGRGGAGLGDAEGFAKALAALGIGTRPFFYPIHQQPALLKRGLFIDTPRLPIAERLSRQGLYIPSGLGLTQEDQAAVAQRVHEALREVTQ